MKRLLLLLLSLMSLPSGAQIINTVAGNGFAGYSGDGASAPSAELDNPMYCTFDDSNNLYISDVTTHLVRKVNPMGIITSYVGSYLVSFGAGGYGGDGGPGTAAKLNMPHGIACDHFGNLFIADQQNFRIRKVDRYGIITTYAGTGVSGFSGDGGPATAAKFQNIWGIAVDDTGNLFVTDISSNRVRKINVSGIITTVAGNGSIGHTGDGGPATAATLYWPIDVATDHSGNIYIADELNNCIRKVNSAGIISTFAGNGIVGYTGDGGPATSAQFHWPTGVKVDKSTGPYAGYIYVSDNANNKIRQISTSGIINSVAGTGIAGYNGDGILANTAQLNSPIDIAVDTTGTIFIADAANNRIRSINNGCIISAIPGISVCTGTSVTYSIGVTPGCISPSYQWMVNSVLAGTGSTYTYTPANGDSIKCIRICSGGSPENSNVIHMAVSPVLVPSVSISSSSSGTICGGTFVTFTSTAVNGGLSPVYQWKVNGVSVGTTNTYTYAPSNGDSIRCILTSSLPCAMPSTVSSSTIMMSVIGTSTAPTIGISASPSDTVCAGVPMTFTATTTGGGATPFYQWKLNGIGVGSGGYSFTYIPANGDSVDCELTSSLSCLTTHTANSNFIKVTVDTITTPSISISAPAYATIGSTVPLVAAVSNAGSSYLIKWMNYGVVFSTTTTPSTTYIKTSGTDVLTAKVSSTSLGCYDTTTSGIILVTPGYSLAVNTLPNSELLIQPNPARTTVKISSAIPIAYVNVCDLLGRQVLIEECHSKEVELNVASLPTGVYLIRINNGTEVRRFFKQ